MAADISIFGIRHHGPGSARRLIEALDALVPATVLIEGPADASHLLPILADPDMVMPVALLTYAEDNPAAASFFPFTTYSPEYQAALWAARHGVPARFIDLPASDRLVVLSEVADDGAAVIDDPISRDPIGWLAHAAGYGDGESWWADVIEQTASSGPVFAAVADAMAALRAEAGPITAREAAREAHMCLEIGRAAKDSAGPVAVVCGAWHVPALIERRSLAADRDLLKGRPKVKIKATWAPWTAPRLARASGYGAGVVAPGWCSHLWDTRDNIDRISIWLTRAARILRERGHFISTASVIETQRLGLALAAMRDRPSPGFEELQEAIVACLCNGERAVWGDVAAELLVGSAVGAIAAATPLAPLLEDLRRQQTATRLKPEALDRALTVDLRSESGRARSILLHRLNALDVPWGRLTDAGRSRGTFRENWVLRWQPEFAVHLIENLVHGSTIEDAASGRLLEAMQAEPDLSALAALVRAAMIADLDRATQAGIALLDAKAAFTSECSILLAALPPMADSLRYGEARAGTAGHFAALMPRIVIQAALALPYASRNLDAEAAAGMRAAILGANVAIQLAQLEAAVLETWHDAQRRVLADTQANRRIAGVAARLLYEADVLAIEAAADLLARMLSPGTPVVDAAGFFEGFLEGAGQRLIHDARLRAAVDGWLMALDAEAFTANLPLFRRVFAVLDRTERRRLMDALLGHHQSGTAGYILLPGAAERWPAHQARITCYGTATMSEEQARRWALALGVDPEAGDGFALSDRDRRMSQALSALYDDPEDTRKKRQGSLAGSAPRVAKWLGDIRAFFPTPIVQIIQRDAFERKGLRQMLLEPEFLATVEADVNLVADLVSLRGVMPEKTKDTARIVIAKVVAALMERLERRTADAIRGALDRSRRTSRPRFADIDWPRTIQANLRHYQAQHRTIVPERLIGFMRQRRRIVDLD